jgi:hypothetical protein
MTDSASLRASISCRAAKSALGVFERIEEHPLHFFVRQSVRRLDLDRLLDLGSQLAGGHAQDAARVDLELHLDARETGGHRRNPTKLEA